MCDFSLSSVELRLFRTGNPKGVTIPVDLSDPLRPFSEVIIVAFLQNFEAENQIRVTFDLTQSRGFVCMKGGMYDHVIGEFLFTDEVFWRAVLDEVKAGKLSDFLHTLRGN